MISAVGLPGSVDQLVDVLLSEGVITSAAVEAAFRAVPRHLFVPEVAIEAAYRNEAIPTKLLNGRAVSSASQPSIVALMLEQLDLAPDSEFSRSVPARATTLRSWRSWLARADES
jgi:protein-L-isoaspartate O-methyltransferase